MTKRIIYPTPDGGVAVIIPAYDARQKVLVHEAVYEMVVVPASEDAPEHEEQRLVVPAAYRDQTDDEFIAWVAAKDVPAGIEFKIVDTADVPSDRTFRAAWEYTA
jgi:hypothetical protein